MVITEMKRLLEGFRQLESKKSQDDMIFQAESMVRSQEALKEDYGLTGQAPPNDAA